MVGSRKSGSAVLLEMLLEKQMSIRISICVNILRRQKVDLIKAMIQVNFFARWYHRGQAVLCE